MLTIREVSLIITVNSSPSLKFCWNPSKNSAEHRFVNLEAGSGLKRVTSITATCILLITITTHLRHSMKASYCTCIKKLKRNHHFTPSTWLVSSDLNRILQRLNWSLTHDSIFCIFRFSEKSHKDSHETWGNRSIVGRVEVSVSLGGRLSLLSTKSEITRNLGQSPTWVRPAP